jgi:hypothetical protein
MSEETRKDMMNINSTTKDNGNIVVGVTGKEKFMHLPFNKKDKYFMNPVDFIKFVKATEAAIRHSPEYNRYIAYLKNDVGLHRCALFSGIDSDSATIEMHHFIFTLYDHVEIQIAHLFNQGDRINSSNVAHNVLKDHFENIILIVPLCEAAHKAYHASLLAKKTGNGKDSEFFIDINSAFGDLGSYIKKYKDDLTITHYMKLRNYFDEYNRRSGKPIKPSIFNESITEWRDVFNTTFAKEATNDN